MDLLPSRPQGRLGRGNYIYIRTCGDLCTLIKLSDHSGACTRRLVAVALLMLLKLSGSADGQKIQR